jgi:catechol 2,3-dioxygenase-like lactoylglutathione lyase family enzyme
MSGSVEAKFSRAVITAAEPQLFVAGIKASCDFFVKTLGFTIVFTYGEPPFYAQVARDGARLNLRCVEQSVIDPVLRDREELLSACRRERGRDRATLPGVPGCGRDVLSDAQARTVGRQRFHHQRSRR